METNVQQRLWGQWMAVVGKMSNKCSRDIIFMAKHVLIYVGDFFLSATPFFWGVVEIKVVKKTSNKRHFIHIILYFRPTKVLLYLLLSIVKICDVL